jgi:hypothetical protein
MKKTLMIVGLMSSLLLAASANAAITYKMYRDAKKAGGKNIRTPRAG